MIKKILAALAAIGAFFSAIFFMLFKNEKDKQKKWELEDRALKAEFDAAIAQKNAELKKEDQELAQKNHSGNKLDNFDAGLDRLRKSSERGQKRSAGNKG